MLFPGTVGENIAYGLRTKGEKEAEQPADLKERIIAAAKLSNAHDFIMSFPQGRAYCRL